MPPPRRFSLRTELLLNIALLAATALSLGVASVMVLYDVLDPEYAAIYISVLVALDVVILLGYVAYQVEKVMLRPLRNAIAAAEAIAAGDLDRRIDPGDTIETEQLAASVNRMTDRLLEERAHLVRAEKMASVGRLAAGIAHEIGNPLGAISGYVHVLRTARPGDDSTSAAVAGLERESVRIDRIVRGLLDYARPSRHPSGRVDLNDVARNVIDLLVAQGSVQHVELHFSPAPVPPIVAGDRHDFEQTLVNLLLNAVDAMRGRGALSLVIRRTTRAELLAGARRASDAGGQPVNRPGARITRWLESAGAEDVAMVVVGDSGPGVPASDQERVFDPFYTTKEPGKGTGLGLAIVARAVENAGGTIGVSSAREGGAAFRMLFPIAGAPSAGASAPAGPARPLASAS
ncbi:MAG: ATP-binding protein [Gemmatimonadaceae bacterium]